MTAQAHDTITPVTAARPRRADAGTVRLSQRDIDGLLLCGEHYGAPFDLLAAALRVQPDRLPAVLARWRRAGYAATGRLGPGPGWCSLTRDGMTATGQGSPPPGRPAPATDAAAAADRDAAAAAISARLKQIETGQNSCILELEQLPADPADAAAAAMRARIRARFGELHAEREQLDTRLTALAATTPRASDPTLLDELPLAGDILPGLPPALKACLLGAFDIQILWNKPGRQATVFAEITDATLKALPAILNPGQDGYDDTNETAPSDPCAVEDLFEAPIFPLIHRQA